MKHEGNLVITAGNAAQYDALVEVTGRLYVREGATLNAPNLKR